jgi:hypothetical protein
MNRLLYQDEARLEYGRRFWRDPERNAGLLAPWLDACHPHRDRFVERRQPLVDRALSYPAGSDDALDAAPQSEGLNLRVVVKEIPPCSEAFGRRPDPVHSCQTLTLTRPPNAGLSILIL